jgi:hypothetical protein
VLPKGLHRIRHYGLFANGNRATNIAQAREFLVMPSRAKRAETSATARLLCVTFWGCIGGARQ